MNVAQRASIFFTLFTITASVVMSVMQGETYLVGVVTGIVALVIFSVLILSIAWTIEGRSGVVEIIDDFTERP